MQPSEKFRLLKSLHLLGQIPENQLATLVDFLKPVQFEDGAVIFDEGSKGASLFFISGGQVRIFKRAADKTSKDLAIMGPGDCFGEMALIEEVARSASAAAVGSCVLFELGREDLNRWLKSHPEQAMQFFAELVQIQSKRLRRTSNELTILFDLSNLLLDQKLTGPMFATQILDRVLTHLEGEWSAAVYLHNEFSAEMEFIAAQGNLNLQETAHKIISKHEGAADAWVDDSTFHVALLGQKKIIGHLVFSCKTPLSQEERNDVGRTLTTVSRLVTSALENISFRTDESLRARLKLAQSYGTSI